MSAERSTIMDLVASRQAARGHEAGRLLDKLKRAGAFAYDDDGRDAKQARTMLEVALRVEDSCRLPGLEALLAGHVDRLLLLQDLLLFFLEFDTSPWNFAADIEDEMFGQKPYRGDRASRRSVFKALSSKMNAFRTASSRSDVLGSLA